MWHPLSRDAGLTKTFRATPSCVYFPTAHIVGGNTTEWSYQDDDDDDDNDGDPGAIEILFL